MTVDWSLCHWPACIEECRDGPKIDCPAVLAWREKKDDKMTDDNGSVSTIPASAETISMTDHLRLMSAQAARIAELEAETAKTRGYRVGHIAGFHAGIRQAAKRYREGDDWDVFATADCAILDLINEDASNDG